MKDVPAKLAEGGIGSALIDGGSGWYRVVKDGLSRLVRAGGLSPPAGPPLLSFEPGSLSKDGSEDLEDGDEDGIHHRHHGAGRQLPG